MLNELIKQRMSEVGIKPTELSRLANLNIATVRKALAGEGKLPTYSVLAKCLGCRIKYTLEV